MSPQRSSKDQVMLLQFLVGHQPYLARLDVLRHVDRIHMIEPVSGAPPWMDGRLPEAQGGLSLLCLAALIGTEAPPPQAKARVLVIEVGPHRLALRTDSGSRVVTVPQRAIGAPPRDAPGHDWIDGVATFAEQVVMIIDPRRAVTAEHIRAIGPLLGEAVRISRP